MEGIRRHQRLGRVVSDQGGPNLRAISVRKDNLKITFNQVNNTLAGENYVCKLGFKGSLVVSLEKSVSAKRYYKRLLAQGIDGNQKII